MDIYIFYEFWIVSEIKRGVEWIFRNNVYELFLYNSSLFDLRVSKKENINFLEIFSLMIFF